MINIYKSKQLCQYKIYGMNSQYRYVNVLLFSFALDGGDKYSAFRELEQPTESKYLGKHYGFWSCFNLVL